MLYGVSNVWTPARIPLRPNTGPLSIRIVDRSVARDADDTAASVSSAKKRAERPTGPMIEDLRGDGGQYSPFEIYTSVEKNVKDGGAR